MKNLMVKFARNIFRYSYYFKLEKLAERIRFMNLGNKPPSLFIEVTNACNLNCLMCPRKNLIRKIEIMNFKLFKKIIDDASRLKIKYIRLGLWGEPLLVPKIFEMVRYAKQKNLGNVGFSTNGVLLNKEKAKKVLETKIDYINFSVDSIDQKNYKKIRGVELNKTIENILFLIKLKKQLGLIKPFISISAVKINQNSREIDKIKDFWKNKADVVNIQECLTFDDNKLRKIVRKNYGKKHACIQPFDRLAIFVDGKVGICCSDLNAKIIAGDMKKENILLVWNNRKIRKIRKIHMNHEFYKIPLCAKCDMIKEKILDLVPVRG